MALRRQTAWLKGGLPEGTTMRMTVRRYRRRRTGSDSLGFAQSRFSAPFFDRLVYLSQAINQTRKPEVP